MRYLRQLMQKIARAAANAVRAAVWACLVALALLLAGTAAAFAQEPGAAAGISDFLTSNLPAWGVVALIVIRQLAELGRKMIPDSAAGGMGILRKVLSLAALYLPNRK